ncbi:MAG TPA: sensor histidine kinase KdpD [Steroidobacteraceae bacterium]|nr:sensor histidine kinase KdpD [Steroidobacteraceae bacterium]
MAEVRPDPDKLLAHVQAEEARAQRGRLRVFFGASAGVGKTYAMLEAARGARSAGKDVVVGYVEPHGRVETERLLEGLEQLPTLTVCYRSLARQELDLDAALKRHPEILLVDELAHSNLTGGTPALRHPKRWQDVEELLEAGISVWTTVNVQHLESLNDLVAQITGVRQRETLPDRVFDEADEVELIDLPPEDLLARLHAGKVYIHDEVANAIERFFRPPNLMALREMALRRVADRVEAEARASAGAGRELQPRLPGERILVATGPDRQSEQLVRAGKRLADALDAKWIVVYVETPALLKLSEAQRNRRINILRLGESLGAETVTIDGPTAAAALLEYAQTRNATRVIVGAPKRFGLKALLRPSACFELARHARGFDVITIAQADHPSTASARRSSSRPDNLPGQIHWNRYAWAVAISAACTIVAYLMYPRFELVNVVMVYLLGTTVAGLRLGRGPSVLTTILNVAIFDFCFVPPQYTFAVSDAQYIVTFAVMLIVGLVTATLMANVRQQTRVAGARERRTALLYAMSRELAATRGIPQLTTVAVRHVAEVFQCKAVVLLPEQDGKLRLPSEPPLEQSLRRPDLAIAQWVADHGREAGLGTDTLPAAPALYVPLGDGERRLGVLAVSPSNRRRVSLPEQRHLLETFAGQIGLALERAQLAEHTEAARVAAERESLRNTLLASISHDLRTPLAAIEGAGGTLATQGRALDETTRESLARSIETKAHEMSELITNVLDLMRFEVGQIVLRRDWQMLEDLIAAAIRELGSRLAAYPVEMRLPASLPQVHVDATLVVKLFVNLLDNVIKYTPPGTRVVISAVPDKSSVLVSVDDTGPGLPSEDPAKLFEKFQRGSNEGTTVGVGLGLAICRAVVRELGGEITARNGPTGGAHFEFTLPTTAPGVQPQVQTGVPDFAVAQREPDDDPPREPAGAAK